MRTSVVIAAIGAAAVLGGVVGAGAMRALVDKRIDALLDRVGALEDKLDARRWWCDDRLCYRSSVDCSGCKQARVAFCAVGKEPTPFCYTTLNECALDVEREKRSNTCIGVE